MKRVIAFVVYTTFVAATARAAEPTIECAPGWPTRCSTPLEAGKVARFSGQLLTPDMAIFLAQSADGCKQVTAIEVDHAKKTAQADSDRDKAIAAADLRAANETAQLYKDAAKRPFYEHPVIVAALAVGATLFVVWAVRKTGQ